MKRLFISRKGFGVKKFWVSNLKEVFVCNLFGVSIIFKKGVL